MIKVFCTLKYLMSQKGFNIKKLQEKTSLSRTTISNLINHYSGGIQFETLELLCKTLECTPGDLLVIHEIDLTFEEKDLVFMELSNFDGNTEELLESKLKCKLILDKESYESDFNLECTFSYVKDDYEIIEIKPSILFNRFISDNHFPSYINDYIERTLNDRVEMHVKDYVNAQI